MMLLSTIRCHYGNCNKVIIGDSSRNLGYGIEEPKKFERIRNLPVLKGKHHKGNTISLPSLSMSLIGPV
jgi:hypothetical protein